MNKRLGRDYVSLAESISAKGGHRLPRAGSEAGTGAGKTGRKAPDESEFETALSDFECVRHSVEDVAPWIWNLQLETLRKTVGSLGYWDRNLI